MGGLQMGETETGRVQPIRVSDDGVITVSLAPGGGGDASAAKQDEQTVHLADIVAEARYDAGLLVDTDTLTCIAALALDVDSRVKFTAQCSAGSRAAEVGGENDTWAYIVIG